ncbi:DUF1206 domain-containing protein [Peribacillus kribbensis]|uniref:DUF1206 domain-containing protein n=1 Tax=Peribacillus kribbensis TaxID=356658 RepID=UPI00041D1AB1|nr:DUF1206 domain-containing protein [Peribacillus kribbensis]
MIDYNTRQSVKDHAYKAAENVKPWIERSARAGFMAKGSVFILVGIFSFLASLGVGHKAKGTNGVFASLSSSPFGEVVLWMIALGLACFSMWQIIRCFHPQKGKKWTERSSASISCCIYIVLTGKAVSLAIHSGHSGGAKELWAARILQYQAGQWLIGGIGAGILLFGIHEIYSGYKQKYMDQFKTADMSEKEITAARTSGRIGLFSRGAVFGVLGFFIMKMAIEANPNHPKSLDGALEKILEQPHGRILLAMISAGFILYGLFEILKGKNRHLKI